MAEHLIPTPALHRWIVDLWLGAGCNKREAKLTADHLVGANLAGHDSHGIGMVPRYVKSWMVDELQLNQEMSIVQDSGAMLTIDGLRGMGQVIAHDAMALAIERAREHGVCIVGLRHSHHLGRVGHWAEQAIAAGMVSIHFVNACSKPIVAPYGGTKGRIGTNPFTIGVPVPGREPILLDFATSAIALGKVRMAYNKKVEVPAGSLLDNHGADTNDPAVMFPPAGVAQGALLPFAGHKGYALSIMCDLLGAALTGGVTTRPANLTMKQAIWNNMLAIVFDPKRMGTEEVFGQEFMAFADWVQSAPLHADSTEILMPGDAERRTRKERAEAVPVDSGTLAEMDEAAATVLRVSGRSPGPLSALEIRNRA